MKELEKEILIERSMEGPRFWIFLMMGLLALGILFLIPFMEWLL
jgi:hypothetical protein